MSIGRRAAFSRKKSSCLFGERKQGAYSRRLQTTRTCGCENKGANEVARLRMQQQEEREPRQDPPPLKYVTKHNPYFFGYVEGAHTGGEAPPAPEHRPFSLSTTEEEQRGNAETNRKSNNLNHPLRPVEAPFSHRCLSKPLSVFSLPSLLLAARRAFDGVQTKRHGFMKDMRDAHKNRASRRRGSRRGGGERSSGGAHVGSRRPPLRRRDP